MKILILAAYDRSLYLFRSAFIRALVQDGHDVVALAPLEHEEVVEKVEKLGATFQHIPLKRTKINPVADLILILNLFLLFKREKPSMIFNYTIKPVIYGGIAGKLANISRINSMITGLGFTFIYNHSLRSKFLNFIITYLYKLGLSYNTNVFFQNKDDANLFINNKIVQSHKVSLVNGSGVDLTYFKQYPYEEGPVCFLMVARLLKAKGVIEYISASKIVNNNNPNTKFILIGPYDHNNPDGLSKSELKSHLNNSNIIHIEWLEDIREKLKLCHVFVLPSYREGVPRSVIEALAAGRAIITTDTPGCRETVEEGKNGILVPIKNTDLLANAMQAMLSGKNIFKSMGANSRKICEERFDDVTIARKMVDIICLNNDRD